VIDGDDDDDNVSTCMPPSQAVRDFLTNSMHAFLCRPNTIGIQQIAESTAPTFATTNLGRLLVLLERDTRHYHQLNSFLIFVAQHYHPSVCCDMTYQQQEPVKGRKP
jgi:hypothetical protein